MRMLLELRTECLNTVLGLSSGEDVFSGVFLVYSTIHIECSGLWKLSDRNDCKNIVITAFRMNNTASILLVVLHIKIT
jgi:hypothetical protein